jgi:hypothetical protein
MTQQTWWREAGGPQKSSKRQVANLKNVTDKETVPTDLSEEDLRRVAEYLSVLREWSLQRNSWEDRECDLSTANATTSVDATKKAASNPSLKFPE